MNGYLLHSDIGNVIEDYRFKGWITQRPPGARFMGDPLHRRDGRERQGLTAAASIAGIGTS